MELPKTKTPKNMGHPTIILHGAPKIGKSTWASQAPSPLFLATEPGLGAIETYQIPITSWPMMLDAAAKIAGGEHDFQTIAVDTVDNAYKLCAEFICKKFEIEHLGDLPRGKGYGAANNEFMRVLIKLAHLPYGLIFLSHTRTVEVKGRAAVYSRQVPALPETSRTAVMGFMDIILYAEAEAVRDEKTGAPMMRRVLRTKPAEGYEAGDRFGLLPETLPLDYAEFSKYLKGE